MSFCPLTQGLCVQSECKFWVTVRGINPNTGQDVDKADCSFAWLPILLIENSQQQRATGAAVEGFRDEMIKGNDALAIALANPPKRGLLR